MNLEFLKNISKNNINFVIILSKLNELRSINNIPFNPKSIIEGIDEDSILYDNNNLEYFIQSKLFKKYIKVKIILINNPKKDDFVKIGAEIYSIINEKKLKEVNFIFSNKLINTFQKKCCELIFGSFNKSYTFSKYKIKKNSIKSIQLNIFNQRTKFKNLNFELNNGKPTIRDKYER